MSELGREFDWNDVIEKDSTYTLLEEGDYDFVVKSFERGRHPGSAKLPPCNKAILTIEVSSDQQATQITHNLFLHSNTEGILCAFFTSIGARKHGEKLVMDWNKVIGARGRCHVIVDTFTKKDGTEGKSNKISRFLEPDEQVSFAAAPSAPAGGWKAGSF